MLKTIIWKTVSENEKISLLKRPLRKKNSTFNNQIREMVERVRREGDVACKEMTDKYDGVKLDNLQVSVEEFEEAQKKINPNTIQSIKKVISQLTAYHAPQRIQNYSVEVSTGVLCESRAIPIERIGLYIPGGTAPLISTALMLGVPSKIAGCPIRILCSPPTNNGNIDPNILVAAELCDIDKVYKLGGAQAIAAMAYGTATIPKVYKIFGPGNSFVTQAKMIVAQDVDGAAYDLPAGPSEVLVVADANANPDYVAADLLAQAEHGSDSQVLLITTALAMCDKVNHSLQEQTRNLARNSIILEALQNSRMIIVDSIEEALQVSNRYAPEHLMLQVDDPRKYLNLISNAGSVFLGKWSPVTAGDYASGTNHVLPTDGYAKKSGGLSVRDFMKSISIQELTKEGLIDLNDTIKVLTEIEGLDAHMNAVTIRLEGKNSEK
ncbi:MAG: histidinol dehydrogenase [Gammaproteobacteria bacterium]|nr:histidinol dehydrogenase [Gammaproteobacteria bacterium]